MGIKPSKHRAENTKILETYKKEEETKRKTLPFHSSKSITTVEYKNKEFLINDNSSFLNINKFKNMYCDITNTLTYVTNDRMGYIVKHGYSPFEILMKEDILYFINEFGVILFKNKVKINSKEINLPVIDCNDNFIQISCSSHKSFYFFIDK